MYMWPEKKHGTSCREGVAQKWEENENWWKNPFPEIMLQFVSYFYDMRRYIVTVEIRKTFRLYTNIVCNAPHASLVLL